MGDVWYPGCAPSFSGTSAGCCIWVWGWYFSGLSRSVQTEDIDFERFEKSATSASKEFPAGSQVARSFEMTASSNIFAKQRLTAGQLRAVAERRFDDAVALCDTGQNARANGAQYLSGIVIEILLKGQLLKLYPHAAGQASGKVADDRIIWTLIWRSHDLADILDRLPLLRIAVNGKGSEAMKPYLEWLMGICNRGTIHARYSPATSTIADAREMISRVRILKERLK